MNFYLKLISMKIITDSLHENLVKMIGSGEQYLNNDQKVGYEILKNIRTFGLTKKQWLHLKMLILLTLGLTCIVLSGYLVNPENVSPKHFLATVLGVMGGMFLIKMIYTYISS